MEIPFRGDRFSLSDIIILRVFLSFVRIFSQRDPTVFSIEQNVPIDARGDCNTVVSPELDSFVGSFVKPSRATLQFIEKLCRTKVYRRKKGKKKKKKGEKFVPRHCR